MPYYFAGGNYPDPNSPTGKSFNVIGTSPRHLYIWDNMNNIKHVLQHAAIYEVGDDFKFATLQLSGGNGRHPETIELSPVISQRLKEAAERLEANKLKPVE